MNIHVKWFHRWYLQNNASYQCAQKMNIPIYHFLDDPFQADNSIFTHLWGAKQIARDNNHQRKLLCAALLNKIEELFPEYYEKTIRMLILCKNDAHVVV